MGAEWFLLDYGDFVVHIFSERARQYYDLERLWRTAEWLDFPAPGETQGGPREEMREGRREEHRGEQQDARHD